MYYGLQWGWRCLAHGDGWDAGPGDAPKGASPGLGKRQSSLEYLLFHCVGLLGIFVQGNGGCIAVYNGAVGVLHTVMGGMPGQATHQQARCPALKNANALLNIFSFTVYVC